MRRWVVLLVIFAATWVWRPNDASAEAPSGPGDGRRPVRVGVVMDGPSDRFEEILHTIELEAVGLTKREFDLRFDPAKRRVADWSEGGIRAAIDELLKDPGVDLLLAHGIIASNEIVTRKQLPKPCIAPFVVDAQQQGLDGGAGSSPRRKNLSYVIWGSDVDRDLKAFLEFGEFKRIAGVLNGYVGRALPELHRMALDQARALGIQLQVVHAGVDVTKILEALPSDAEAVYVGPNSQLSHAQMKALARGLIDRGLPSFSWSGRQDVENGMLAALRSADDVVRLARRVALNMQSILLGGQPSELSTVFRRHEQLVVNMATARAINLWPNWSILADAELIDERKRTVRRKLSLEAAVREALKANPDIAAAKRRVEAGSATIRQSRAGLLPQLALSAGVYWIDEDRAAFGNAERTAQWGLGLSQSIYSEPTWAGYRIQQQLQEARKHEADRVRLDIVWEVAVAYLNLLQSKTLERIQRENLRLSRDNLALARVRHQIGAAGAGEVFRWEAQIANARRDVISSAALRNQAEIAVNQVLNRPQEEPFATRESTLTDAALISSEPKFRQYLDNPFRFRVMRDFLVEEASKRSPELRQLQATLRAKERERLAAQRSFYVPSVDLNAGLTHRFYRGGAGSEPAQIPPLPDGTQLDFPFPDEWDWSVGLSASLPLFAGNGRSATLDRNDQELAELRMTQRSLQNRVEQRVRSALHQAGASYPAIRLSRDAAEAALGNLELVTDAYSQGEASIIQLLDAQNQALVSELSASNAVFAFLADLMEVQRAIGQFSFFLNAEDRRNFFDRLDRFNRARTHREGERPILASPTGAEIPSAAEPTSSSNERDAIDQEVAP